MRIEAETVEAHLAALPEDRAEVLNRLRDTVRNNLPEGFEEQILYDMISYVVPFERYPDGYHVDPGKPLGFIAIAAQKRHYALYHGSVYADPELKAWFQDAYAAANVGKLDMGKSCIRFSSEKKIPWELIAELCRKVTVEDYIKQYESIIKTYRKRN